MNSIGEVSASGSLGLEVIKPFPTHALTIDEIKFHALPHRGLTEEVADWRSDNRKDFKRGFDTVKKLNKYNLPGTYGGLFLRKIAANGIIINYGLGSLRVVTDAGVAFICNAFTNGVELEIMKFHGLGTGTTAEATTDTVLVTELTTQYAVSGTRATGTLATASTTGSATFTTVGQNTLNTGASITEHGIFSQGTVGGTLLDRSKFTAVALSAGDSLQTTYVLTVSSGG